MTRMGCRQHGEGKKPIRWVKKYTVRVTNKVSKIWCAMTYAREIDGSWIVGCGRDRGYGQ
jgi:hypothetical protein